MQDVSFWSRGASVTLALSTLALCALFIAHGTTSCVAAELIALAAGAARSGKPSTSPKPAGTDPPDVLAILERNAFDPATGQLPKPLEPAPPAVVKLTTTRGKRSATPVTASELDAAITKLGEARYRVKRSFVDKLLGDPAQLMRIARVSPREENGRATGLQLYGIQPGSLLGKLGLKDGDLLRSINGLSVADVSAALDAFVKLRSASDLRIAITRSGRAAALRVGIAE